MVKSNQEKLNTLKKFNVIVDEATEQAILSGMITVTDVLREYGQECCQWDIIYKPSNEYTFEEREFFDKFIYNLLEIGKERDVVIDYAEDKDTITVQVKHRDLWLEFQRDVGLANEWYGYYLKWSNE